MSAERARRGRGDLQGASPTAVLKIRAREDVVVLREVLRLL